MEAGEVEDVVRRRVDAATEGSWLVTCNYLWSLLIGIVVVPQVVVDRVDNDRVGRRGDRMDTRDVSPPRDSSRDYRDRSRDNSSSRGYRGSIQPHSTEIPHEGYSGEGYGSTSYRDPLHRAAEVRGPPRR